MTLWGRLYFAKNIDNLLVQQVDPTNNKISAFMFHSVLYYYFLFNSGFQQFDELFVLVSHEDHNSIGCLWQIDIKSVRSISYDLLVYIVMVFN
jgi:hypothetical protein